MVDEWRGRGKDPVEVEVERRFDSERKEKFIQLLNDPRLPFSSFSTVLEPSSSAILELRLYELEVLGICKGIATEDDETGAR